MSVFHTYASRQVLLDNLSDDLWLEIDLTLKMDPF